MEVGKQEQPASAPLEARYPRESPFPQQNKFNPSPGNATQSPTQILNPPRFQDLWVTLQKGEDWLPVRTITACVPNINLTSSLQPSYT